MSWSIEDLRDMSDDELIRAHDRLAKNTQAVGVNYYLEELARRRSDRQQTTMIRLTWAIAAMTLVVTIATIVNLMVFIAG
jgi:hypothetical protein